MSENLLHELKLDDFDAGEIAGRISLILPEDGAVALEVLPWRVAVEAAAKLDPKVAGAILRYVEPATAARLMGALGQDQAAAILAAMPPDDRVDLLEELDRPLHDALVKHLSAAQAAETRQLEQYPPDTAGGIMTTQFTALHAELTVEQAIAELRRVHEQLGQLFYVYVIDEQHRLVGVLSMRDLILARPGSTIAQVMIPRVKSVPVTLDQEEVARQMRGSRFLALPVVDQDARLVGLVTLDDVMDVLQEEATEDMQRMFGAGAEERLSSPWQFSFSRRIGWLQVNLATAFLAGGVVGLFGKTIGRFAVLAMYMPIVSGMGSNAGAQAMSVAIRGIAHGRTDRKLLRHVLSRELIVGGLTGLIVGCTTALIAILWQYKHGPALGLVVGASLIFTQTLACVTGAGIPFLMRRLGFDPAQSATIFATTVTDVAGFASLLGLAKLCEGWMR
jgi:magnesium transporter